MAIGIAVTTKNRLIVETRTDIINHLYIEMLDVLEQKESEEKKKKRTRIVNVYNNHLLVDQASNKVGSNTKSLELTNVIADSIIDDRVVFLGRFNTHCQYRNLH